MRYWDKKYMALLLTYQKANIYTLQTLALLNSCENNDEMDKCFFFQSLYITFSTRFT